MHASQAALRASSQVPSRNDPTPDPSVTESEPELRPPHAARRSAPTADAMGTKVRRDIPFRTAWDKHLGMPVRQRDVAEANWLDYRSLDFSKTIDTEPREGLRESGSQEHDGGHLVSPTGVSAYR